MTPSDLASHRKSLGLSQDRAAAVFGVHRVTWVRWETGAREIPPTAKVLMSVLLEIPQARKLVGLN